MPFRAKALIAITALAGAVAAGIQIPSVGGWTRSDLVMFGVLLAAIVIAEMFPLPLYQRTEIVYFSVTDAVWMAGLLLAPASVVVLSVAGGVLIGQKLQRRATVKAIFNAGMFTVAMSAAAALHGALTPSAQLSSAALLSAGAAMGCAFAIYATATALIVAMVEGRSVRSILLPALGADVAHWGANITIGLAAAIAYGTMPALIPFLGLVLMVCRSGYRGWLQPYQPLQPALVQSR